MLRNLGTEDVSNDDVVRKMMAKENAYTYNRKENIDIAGTYSKERD